MSLFMSLDAETANRWTWDAVVQTSTRQRLHKSEPDIESGDLWYRITISLDSPEILAGEPGPDAEFNTGWHWSLEEAVKAAKMFKSLLVTGISEGDEDFVEVDTTITFDAVIDRAVANYLLASPAAA